MNNLGLRQLGINASLTLSKQFLTALLGLLSVVIITRTLGPEGNGIYQMVILLPTMLVTLSNMGIGSGTVYYIARKDYTVQEVIKGNILLGIFIGVISCLLSSIVVLFWSEILFPGIPENLLYAIIIVIPISLLQSYMLTIFQGLQDFKTYNMVSVLPQAVILVFLIIALWILGGGVIFALIAYILGNGIALLMSIYYLRDYINLKTVFNRNYIRATLNYGWKAHLSNIFAFLNYRLDMFLVNGLLNPFAVGLYSLAVQIVERLWILSQAVSTVLLPRISELKDDETKRGLITPFISRWVLMITASGSLLLALAAPFLIPLIFGMEFAGSVVALQVILVGITLGSASRILANDIAARGRPELNLYCSVIAILINLVGNLLFIPLMGITGAALATTISYGLNTLMKIYLYARISKIKWYKTIIPEKKDFILLISLIFIRKSANTAP